MNKPKRHWLRYSLRTFLIAFTLIAVVLGIRLNQIHRQRQAVALIRSLGGEVAYDFDYEQPAKKSSEFDNWLNEITGSSYVDTVALVGKIFDNDFLRQYVLRFSSLDHLHLVRTSVTDEGLAELKSLKFLTGLYLHDVPIAKSSLLQLKSLPSLTYLLYLRDQGNLDIAKAIWKPTNCDVVEMPLEDFVTYLKNLHNIEITFDTEELLAADMDAKNVSITANIKGLPLNQVLDNLLDSHEMGWIIRKGTVVVTTREIAASSRADREVLYELKAALPQLEIVVD